MAAPKPSLDLLRAMTDEHVLRAVMKDGGSTRVQIAARTGISKPTIYDSVGRLIDAGVLVDTGERTTGRGRVGTYYSLADSCGSALVASLGAGGVQAEAIDAFGEVRARTHVDLGGPARRDVAEAALAEAAARLAAQVPGSLRTCVVSAAEPVDRATGRLVPLPDTPFPVGGLDPAAVLRPAVAGPIEVDNDVNWAARAEHESGSAAGVDDFVYLYLGEGLGCAVVSDGQVRRGHRGLAGEISHLMTQGPDGRALALIDVFAVLGLRHSNSTAIDADAVRAAALAEGARADRVRSAIAQAVSGAIVASITLLDPSLVVIGGTWGVETALLGAFEACLSRSVRKVPVAAASISEPELAGARTFAIEQLRREIVKSPLSSPMPDELPPSP